MFIRSIVLLSLTIFLFGTSPVLGDDQVKQSATDSPATKTTPTDDVTIEHDEGNQTGSEEGGGEATGNEEGGKKEVTLKGVFAPTKFHRVQIDTDEWSSLEIRSIAPHGTKVEPGQTILAIDKDGIEKAIHDAELEQQLGRLALELAEKRINILRKKSPLELAEAERAVVVATQDLQEFLTREREQTKESLAFSLQSAENRLAYEEEELKQLERMYEADEITEETEEIILRRTRDSVKSARFQLKRARASRDKGLNITLDRTLRKLEKAVSDATLALEQAQIDLPNKVRKAEIDLAQLRISRMRADEKLDTLRSDLEQLSVDSPIAGFVYHGDITDGNIGRVAAAVKANTVGKTIKPHQPVMTVIERRKLMLRTKIEEVNLGRIQVGMVAVAIPVAHPNRKLAAMFREISTVPVGEGEFAAELTVEIPDDLDLLMPGMKCEILVKTPAEEES